MKNENTKMKKNEMVVVVVVVVRLSMQRWNSEQCRTIQL